jgi:hypothetical protein
MFKVLRNTITIRGRTKEDTEPSEAVLYRALSFHCGTWPNVRKN